MIFLNQGRVIVSNPYFIVIHRYDGITNGTHYPNQDAAEEEAKRKSIEAPNNIFQVCEVKASFEILIDLRAHEGVADE